MNILTGFTHSTVTDLARGRINNQDAMLLLLALQDGAATAGQLRRGMQAWRPGLHFTYLFNTCDSGGYGFVGRNFTSTHNEVYHQGRHIGGGCTTKRRTYWYRSGRGRYSLTAEGIRRLGELGLSTWPKEA